MSRLCSATHPALGARDTSWVPTYRQSNVPAYCRLSPPFPSCLLSPQLIAAVEGKDAELATLQGQVDALKLEVQFLSSMGKEGGAALGAPSEEENGE